MTKSKLIAIFMGVAAAAGVGFLVFQKTGPAVKETASVVETKWDKGDDRETKGDEGEKGDKGETDWTTYENSTFGFSLKHPKEFRVAEFDDERGKAVVFQEPGKDREFQIFISEFDEPGPITVEMVRRDLPGLVVEEVRIIALGSRTSQGSPTSKTVEALIFFSRDESLGRIREAWFIWPEDPSRSGNYLFQVTARAELDEELSRIMATFGFN